MGYLKQKSDFNLATAQILIQNNLYSPSIHCAYYSCLQLLKYILKNFIGIEYAVQERAANSGSSGGSHNYVINEVFNQIRVHDRLGYGDLKRKVGQLKRLRTQSDYLNVQVTYSESTKALEYAYSVRKYLIDKMI